MNNIDWDNAPEGAEFYAQGFFRRAGSNPAIPERFSHTAGGVWGEGWCTLHDCRKSIDYCERPQTQQNAATIAQEALKGDDPVNHPRHYQIAPEVEAIDIIRASLTPEQFKGYLLGNFLKYRLRAGDKGDLNQDIEKSNWYKRELNK